MANQQRQYGLEKLYAVPYFQTREQYRQATGQEPPPFDTSRPPQGWYDPSLANSTKRTVLYENVLAVDENGQPKRDENGNPYFESLMMLRSEASTVNIPNKVAANEPGTDIPEIPVPLRPLFDDESLTFGFGGIVQVVNNSFSDKPLPNAGYGDWDRDLLVAIAKKIGVLALLLIAVIFAMTPVVAQTSVSTTQITAPTSTTTTVMVALPDGKISVAMLGPGIQLDTTTTPPTLTVTAAKLKLVTTRLTADKLTPGCTLHVGGLIQLEGFDYNVSSDGTITWLWPKQPSDVVASTCIN